MNAVNVRHIARATDRAPGKAVGVIPPARIIIAKAPIVGRVAVMLDADADRAGIAVIPGVVAIGFIMRVADVAIVIAREHEAMLGLGIVKDRTDGGDAAIETKPAKIGHILADEDAAAGEIGVLTKLPLAGEDRNRAGPVIEGQIMHRGEGIEGFPDIAVEILRGEESDGRRRLAVIIIAALGNSRETGCGRKREGERKAPDRDPHRKLLSSITLSE